MAGFFPTTPGPREVSLKSHFFVAVSRAQSGRRFARSAGGHYWQLRASWSPMTADMFAPIEGFLAAQQGAFEAFAFIHPSKKVPRGVATGTPIVSGANQVGTNLNTSGWTANITGIMKAGDLIGIAGQTKVYMLTADANSGATGLATLIISPPLMQSPAASAAIVTSNVPFTVALDEVYEARARTRGIIDSFDIVMTEHIAT